MAVGGEHAASIQDIIENLNKVETELHPEGKKPQVILKEGRIA